MKHEYKIMGQEGIYLFATKSYHTAGHAEIYAQGDFVRPQVHEAIIAELKAYQVKHGMMPFSPER
jgi:hypothetical protein